MSSRIFDVSSEMGQLLIQGWILTDRNCSTCGAPLMKSPRSIHPTTIKCVGCSTTVQEGVSQDRPASLSTLAPNVINRTPSASAHSESGAFSDARLSTPPTEQLSLPPSPGTDEHPINLLDTADILRRRAQSDRASSEIGRRMLQGWAMLADECPNPTCYGVPLIRPPRGKDGEISKVKECVICGGDYGSARIQAPTDPLPPLPLLPSPPVPYSAPNILAVPNETPDADAEISLVPSKVVQRDNSTREQGALTSQETAEVADLSSNLKRGSRAISELSAVQSALATTKDALVSALSSLNSRLKTLSNQQPLPHRAIGEVASAITDTARALREVSEVQHLY